MAVHNLAYDPDNTTDEVVAFTCSRCKRSIGLHHPKTKRTPAAVAKGDSFEIPTDDPDLVGRTIGDLC